VGNCKATDTMEVNITIPQILVELQRCARVVVGADELAVMYKYNCKFSNDSNTTFLVLYSCRVIDYIIKINVLCSIIIESTYM
jgi:hypothetical protein